MTKSILLAFFFVSGLGCGTASEVYDLECAGATRACGGRCYLVASGIDQTAVTSISTLKTTSAGEITEMSGTRIDDDGNLVVSDAACISGTRVKVTLRYD